MPRMIRAALKLRRHGSLRPRDGRLFRGASMKCLRHQSADGLMVLPRFDSGSSSRRHEISASESVAKCEDFPQIAQAGRSGSAGPLSRKFAPSSQMALFSAVVSRYSGCDGFPEARLRFSHQRDLQRATELSFPAATDSLESAPFLNRCVSQGNGPRRPDRISFADFRDNTVNHFAAPDVFLLRLGEITRGRERRPLSI